MKRSLGALGLFLFGAFASGCPVYSDNVPPRECFYATDCPLGYRCSHWGECVQSPPHGGPSGDGGASDASTSDATRSDASDAPEAALPDAPGDAPAVDAPSDATSSDATPAAYCGNPSDCAAGETCSSDGTCRAGSCSTIGCVNQFQCTLGPNGAPVCMRSNIKGCAADRDCVRERCIDGQCTPVTDVCTDRTQCSPGKLCVEGRCITACSNDTMCPAGSLCRAALGYCGDKAKSCTLTSDCQNTNEVCVDGACFPRCTAVGACCDGGSGLCVDNGCVPRTGVATQCTGNGTPCGPVGENNVCVRGHCYAACTADGGGCDAQSNSPVCRTMAVGSATYNVCSAADIGNDCNPSLGDGACGAGKVCIDGFCK